MSTDPYKYFRVEAHELLEGLTQGALELEKGAADRAMVGSLLRLAHTLKGASRVVKQPAMADLAHGVEDILSPFRDAETPVPKDLAQPMLQLLDRIGTGLAALDHPASGSVAPASGTAFEETLETVRVDVEEVEGVLNSLSEAAVLLRRMEHEAEALNQARRLASQLVEQMEPSGNPQNGAGMRRIRPLAEELSNTVERLARRFGSGIDEVQREISLTWECANHLRLLPARSIFPAVLRTVRDAAVALGKQAQLETAGGDIRLDAHVLVTVRDAIIQLVRNAVAHGLESPEGRTAAGKPLSGHVHLGIERRGNRVAFTCRDDGGGIDVAAIRRAAVKKGAVSPRDAESLGLREAIDLILRGGVTTTTTPTGISGRGIGLDVVRELTARLKGEVSVDTASGQGTTVEICVPVSLTSVPALLVESDGVHASIPLDCVCETLRIAATDIVRGAAGEFAAYAGRTVPFFPLSRLLKGVVALPREHWSAVIVAAGADRVAVGVDRLAGSGTVIVRSLPPVAAATRVVAGASLDSGGNPQLVLDPAGLVEAAGQPETGTRTATALRPPVLVVDDSLTTRMVEQSILESAGHAVEVAQSGEEALEKARGRPYSLFLVDVEMPGMDGFEFVARTREDPVLRDTPAVLVTSRSSPEDRMRGQQAGARAYIVKSEFDQGLFLQTIQQLVGC
ncbi:MAG: response regulator [Acidobacteriia bacterium]|nr:response regulator [Terriglobia bacterium]